jgi:hypothetical protein
MFFALNLFDSVYLQEFSIEMSEIHFLITFHENLFHILFQRHFEVCFFPR